MTERQVTALCGALRRVAPNVWQWSDGAPAEGVTDAHPNFYYNFRVRTRLRGEATDRWVEVPVQLAYEDEDLAWIRAWAARGELASDATTEPPRAGGERPLGEGPRVYLVPLEAWDAWSSATVIGCRWPAEAQGAILERAKRFHGGDA